MTLADGRVLTPDAVLGPARPGRKVVIAADTGGRSPAGVRVFDRWNETEELLLDIERLLGERQPSSLPKGAE